MSALAVVVALACALAATIAQGSVPRRRPPNMAAMTIQPSDLAPGSLLASQGYSRPPRGFRAQYDRSFRVARAPGGGAPFELDTELVLAPTNKLAARTVMLERALYASKAGRGLLSAVIVSALKHARLSQRSVRFGKPVSLAIGKGSFMESASVRTKQLAATAYFAELDVGPVAGTMTFVGDRRHAAPGDRVGAGRRGREPHHARSDLVDRGRLDRLDGHEGRHGRGEHQGRRRQDRRHRRDDRYQRRHRRWFDRRDGLRRA